MQPLIFQNQSTVRKSSSTTTKVSLRRQNSSTSSVRRGTRRMSKIISQLQWLMTDLQWRQIQTPIIVTNFSSDFISSSSPPAVAKDKASNFIIGMYIYYFIILLKLLQDIKLNFTTNKGKKVIINLLGSIVIKTMRMQFYSKMMRSNMWTLFENYGIGVQSHIVNMYNN